MKKMLAAAALIGLATPTMAALTAEDFATQQANVASICATNPAGCAAAVQALVDAIGTAATAAGGVSTLTQQQVASLVVTVNQTAAGSSASDAVLEDIAEVLQESVSTTFSGADEAVVAANNQIIGAITTRTVIAAGSTVISASSPQSDS